MNKLLSMCRGAVLAGAFQLWAVGGPALPRSTPEAQGVSSAELLGFIRAADARIDGLHSFMMVRHGAVIAEGWWRPYRPDSNHVLFSLSKSFTSTAVGLAVAEGKLSIHDPVLQFFPEEAPAEVSLNLRAMRVRDLLMMATGHQDEPPIEPDMISVKTFLAQPVPHRPGTHFKYNTAATFLLSAIVQKQTGESVLEYLRPRLFEPLGIANPVWAVNAQGITLGGYGLRLRTEDLARFGQLYLQRGEWAGRRLLPEDWVAMATSRQVANGSSPDSDWNQGYGFQFWRCRHGAYRGDGAFGQYCLVLPGEDAVIAITSGVRDMQAVLNLIWERLLPLMRSASLPEDEPAVARLRSALGELSLSEPEGSETSGRGEDWVGRRFRFAGNPMQLESLELTRNSDGGGFVLTLRSEDRVARFPCAFAEWREGRADLGVLAREPLLATMTDEPVVARLAWPDPESCWIKICATETPFVFTIRLRLEGGQLTVEGGSNVAFGPSKWPLLTGVSE